MPLRNQPYLPLYVQDFMTDEKLIECSASATGIYIKLMCILHKQENYGTILLKQKYKQTDQQIKNFAVQFATSLPWDVDEIFRGLTELFNEKIIKIEGDLLYQKRMVHDNDVSEKRAAAGSSGGKKTSKKFAKAKVKAKHQAKPVANTDNEIDIEDETVNENENEIQNELGKEKPLAMVKRIWVEAGLFSDNSDTKDLREVCEKILSVKDMGRISDEKLLELESTFSGIIKFIKKDGNVKYYGSFAAINKHLSKIVNSIKNGKPIITSAKAEQYLKENGLI